jgi:allantoate deiminase
MELKVSPELEITAERLGTYVTELAAVGRTPEGGISRPVYSDAWAVARRQVGTWMEEIGLQVRSDAVGNLFGRVEGTEPGSGVVLTGSHIDTVPNGGPLDGAAGIHAGLTAVGALVGALGRPRRSIEVVAVCEEESARFPADYWGARAMTGLIRPEDPATITDASGLTIGEAMRHYGFEPAAIPSAKRTDLLAFVELHIEQGRVLYDEQIPVGIVSAITGQHRIRVTVRGRPDHAGATPMDLRRDAYLGAAEMGLGIAGVAEQLGRPAVATVGSVQLAPGAVNVVPGEAVFTLDTRHPDPETLRDMVERIRALCQAVAQRRGLKLEWAPWMQEEPQPMDASLRGLLERCADDLGIQWKSMVSGAGHDSQVMARHVPTAMIFVPSWEGHSHSPDEHTPPEQMVPGVRVLAEALRRLAYVASP